MEVPTREEFVVEQNLANAVLDQYSGPRYICPKCGGNMRKNRSIVLTTYPPKFRYECDKCDFWEII